MIHHNHLATTDIFRLLKAGEIAFAGNRKLKIYGLLKCRSGKRMKAENRVFFSDEAEAIRHGYRPCKICMKSARIGFPEKM